MPEQSVFAGKGFNLGSAFSKGLDTVKQHLNTAVGSSGPGGQVFQGLQSAQKNYAAGSPWNAYSDFMGARRTADEHGIADKAKPLLASQGGWAPQAWDVAGFANKAIGTPEAFSKTMGGLAPGLLKGVGHAAGLPGLVGAYGLMSGNRGTMQDLQKVMPWLPKIGSAEEDLIDIAAR